MTHRLGVLAVILAVSAGSLLADNKREGPAQNRTIAKGSVVNFDMAKKAIRLKTADGQKEYTAADDLVVFYKSGDQVGVSLRKQAGSGTSDRSWTQNKTLLQNILKPETRVLLILGNDDRVKEVRVMPSDDKPAGGAPTTKGAATTEVKK
jgi:hypothetical protein